MTRAFPPVMPLLALLVAIVGALALSLEPAAAQETVAVSLAEFMIDVGPGSAVEGPVTFRASNDGTIPHNLRVIRTDLAPDSLPTNEAAFMVDEGGVDVVASSVDLTPGQTTDVAANLAPGSYVLICNIPIHYAAGMQLGFQVTAGPAAPTTTSAPADDAPAATVTPSAADVNAPPATGQGPGGTSAWSWWALMAAATFAKVGATILWAGAGAYGRGR